MKMVSVASISTLNYQVERTVRRMLRRGSDIAGDEVASTFYSFLHIIYIIFLLKATNRFQDYLAVNQEAAMVFLMECRDQVTENVYYFLSLLTRLSNCNLECKKKMSPDGCKQQEPCSHHPGVEHSLQ